MGKYTEALRKLEEERKKKKLESSGAPSKSSFRNLRAYAIGTTVCVAISLLLVYAYGVLSGTRLATRGAYRELPSRGPTAEVEPPSPQAVDPSRSVDPLTEGGDNALLLESVEKMIELSYQDLPPVQQEENAEDAEAQVQRQDEFYTIQLVTYENRERAKEEANTLRVQGHQTFILRSNRFYTVCVGKFADASRAARSFPEIRSVIGEATYPDAFVRFVKPKEGD